MPKSDNRHATGLWRWYVSVAPSGGEDSALSALAADSRTKKRVELPWLTIDNRPFPGENALERPAAPKQSP